MNAIDRASYFNEWTNKSPKAKVFFGLGALVLSLFLQNSIYHLVLFIFLSGLLLFGARISGKIYFKLLKLPFIFLILSFITILLSVGKEEGDFLLSLKLGIYFVGITKAGLETSILVFFRALAGIASMYFIALTTPITQLVGVFKWLKMPTVFLEMLILIYRFITLFMEEFEEMQVGIDIKNGSRTKFLQLKSTATLGYVLFRRVMDSYQDWNTVLEMKLYDGNFYF